VRLQFEYGQASCRGVPRDCWLLLWAATNHQPTCAVFDHVKFVTPASPLFIIAALAEAAAQQAAAAASSLEPPLSPPPPQQQQPELQQQGSDLSPAGPLLNGSSSEGGVPAPLTPAAVAAAAGRPPRRRDGDDMSLASCSSVSGLDLVVDRMKDLASNRGDRQRRSKRERSVLKGTFRELRSVMEVGGMGFVGWWWAALVCVCGGGGVESAQRLSWQSQGWLQGRQHLMKACCSHMHTPW
jgi:hypothetical protein